MRIGNSVVDFKALLIESPTGCHAIEPIVMRILQVLAENAGEVMSREQLITAVWGVEFGGDERLSRGISILRKVLGDKRGEHTHIVTISGTGYRLIAKIDPDEKVTRLPSNQLPVEKAFTGSENNIEASTANELSDPLNSMRGNSATRRSAFKSWVPISGLIAACFFIALIFFSGNRAGESISLQAKMDRGYSHVENFASKGAIEDAQDIFSEILSADPDHAAARAGLAFAVFREYTHLERDPALLQRGKAHAEAALRNDEHLASANIAVAWAAEFEGDFERAHEHLDRAIILEADNMQAIESRYRTFGKQGQIEKARAVIDAAILTYPDRALFYTYRGGFFMRKDEFQEAEKDFMTAISLSPDNSRTYAELAHSLHMQGRTDEAVSVIQRGLSINNTALLYNNLGTYLFFQGQYDLAAPAFEKTLELSGDTHSHLYWANLGDAYRWSKNKKSEASTSYKRALQLLQVDLDQNPTDANLKSRAALFNAKLGDLDKVQSYMDSFELTSSSPAIQLYRAVVTYEIMSNRTKALEFLGAAIRSNYPLTEILNDPELAQLRQDQAYHRLLAKLQN